MIEDIEYMHYMGILTMTRYIFYICHFHLMSLKSDKLVVIKYTYQINFDNAWKITGLWLDPKRVFFL